MEFSKMRAEAIDDIIEKLTFDGAFKRAGIYAKSVEDFEKNKFRKSIMKQLKEMLEKPFLEKVYNDENHYKIIEEFCNNMTAKHTSILKDGRLRIGNAQKLVNVYWKCNWLLKENIQEPIHCPFDSIIIKQLDKSLHNKRWTQIKEIYDYQLLVKTAREKAKEQGLSLAKWELKHTLKKRNSY